jgi:carbon storage regulator
VYIGENIFVEIIDIDRGRCRIGIQADRSVPIFRKELLADHHPSKPFPPATGVPDVAPSD